MSGSQEAFVAPVILRELERGATVVLVPASDARRCDWPGLREVIAAEPPTPVANGVVAMYWESQSEGAGVAELAELMRCAVRRRLTLGRLRDGVNVEARYADGEPAIMLCRRGAGRLILLSTAPDPDWSDLGVRAAGMLTWLYWLIEGSVGTPGAIRHLSLGQQTREPFSTLPVEGLVRVVLLSAPDVRPFWIRMRSGKPIEPWPTRRVGLYAIYAGASEPAAMYAVNVPPQECRLERIGADEIARRLGVERVAVVPADVGEPETSTKSSTIQAWAEPRRLLAGLLMALFVAELLLSSRRGAEKPGPVAA